MGFGGKGGPSGTTTSVQNTQPWAPQQPFLEQIFSSAQGLYGSGGPQYFPGQTYAPPSEWQNAAINNAETIANNDYSPNVAENSLTPLLNGTALAGNPSLPTFKDLGSINPTSASPLIMNALTDYGLYAPRMVANGPGSYALGNIAAGSAYNNPGSAAFAPYASGLRLAEGNPNTSGVARDVLSQVVPSIESQFIQGGALNSPEAARAVSAGATAALAPELFQQFQQEEANQLAAGGQQSQSFLQAAGLQNQAAATQEGNNLAAISAGTNAAGSAAGLNLQGTGLQEQALTGAENAYNDMLMRQIQGLALAPQTESMLYTPWSQLYSAGATSQELNQQAINDAVQRYNYQQTLPYQNLNEYIGQVTGNYGGTATLTQPYFQNTAANALGGAAAGAQLGSSLLGSSGLGLVSNGVGSAIGGGAGLLFGLLSDRRTKTDVKAVGELDNGLTVYSFRYHGEPEGMRHIGLMADEVEEEHPEAVNVLPAAFGSLAGYKTVDYARAVE